jgi:formate hydrogenlyase subunit 3/multisubunit Na+/H+ antiporter MnhD subunit
MTLSTPIIWVVFPLVIATLCVVLSKRPVLSLIIASATAFGLALLAAFLPQELTLSLGPLTFAIEESLRFLGRRITLVYAMLPFIAFIYGATGLWLLSSNLPGVPTAFRPISLVITSSLTAALGVEPFLYAALLIETAVLVSVPMLISPGQGGQQGILRYLGLMTIAMPFILIAGWLLTGVVILPPDSPLIGQSAILLGLGFALWLAVFPFHSWVPMVSQRGHPTVVSFLLFVLPSTILVFGLNFLNRYAFLRTSAEIFNIIRIIGVMMILFGGVWTAVQDHLERAFGFSVLVETGFSLLAIGLAASGGLKWLLMLFPARALGYWMWGYTLTRLEHHCGSLEVSAIQGYGRRLPIISAGLILAQLSIAGLPLLASFPIKIALLTRVLLEGTGLGVWSFIGSLGLFLFTIRLILNLFLPIDIEVTQLWFIEEKTSQFLPVLLLLAALVVSGLFPGIFSSGLTSILTAFPQLQ